MQPRRLPLRRKLAYAFLLVVALPLSLLLLAELGVRLFVAVPDDDPYLNLLSPASVFSKSVVDGRECYVVTHREAYSDRKISFPIAKPAGTLRIFCLGGSAAAGWPHPSAENYAWYLRQMLALALPDQAIEVNNVAGHGFASYRVHAIFDEVIDFEPDLIIVYSGNNEFVEKRSYLRETGLLAAVDKLAEHSRLAALLLQWAKRPRASLSGAGNQELAYHLWSHIEQIASELRSDPAQLQLVEAHYAYTMRAMARRAAARGVPIVFLTVPVNLRDWHPNVSRHVAIGEALQRWEVEYRTGRRAVGEERFDDAADRLRRAASLDPEHADTWFRLGRALERQGKHDEAWQAYLRAKDADGNPFRALSSFNASLRDLPNDVAGASIVDMERVFRDHAERGAPGFDLFLDYVHPTKRGNLLLARTLLPAVLALLGRGSAEVAEAAGRRYVENDYDEAKNHGMQNTLLQLFWMMHQYESFVAKADTLLAAAKDQAAADIPVDLITLLRGKFAAFLDEERKDYAGLPHATDYREQLERFYRESFQLTERAKGGAPPANDAGTDK